MRLPAIRWADLIDWLPHEEHVNGEWMEVSGSARDDQADYFRAQLSLFARLSYGRNKLASSTIVELVPLEALLLLLLPETMAGASGKRLLARDRQLCCELLRNYAENTLRIERPSGRCDSSETSATRASKF